MDSVSLSHHTVVEIATKIHEPSMQLPQYNCRVLYPRVSSLYETDDRAPGGLPGTMSGPITIDLHMHTAVHMYTMASRGKTIHLGLHQFLQSYSLA
jgi:hypothetical protein